MQFLVFAGDRRHGRTRSGTRRPSASVRRRACSSPARARSWTRTVTWSTARCSSASSTSRCIARAVTVFGPTALDPRMALAGQRVGTDSRGREAVAQHQARDGCGGAGGDQATRSADDGVHPDRSHGRDEHPDGGPARPGAGLLPGHVHLSTSSANLIAREKAREAVESVHTARDTRHHHLGARSGTSRPAGCSSTAPQPLRGPGLDGLVNTEDDARVLEDATGTRPGWGVRHGRRPRDAARGFHAPDRDQRAGSR